MSTIPQQLDARGFAIVDGPLLSPAQLAELERLAAGAQPGEGGQRNLLDLPEIQALANSGPLCRLVESLVGPKPFAVRAILFDKTPEANWKVAWHQDLTIAVLERMEVEGFGPWSTKAGVIHVQPPAEYLDEMLAVRLHLDECGPNNGPLRVLPGSHRAGKIPEDQIPALRRQQPEEVCCVPKGGAIFMRPLLLHASSPAAVPAHRRVIHIEYASRSLPNGLRWRWHGTSAVCAA
jgi:Phytanoyl-CoA dioxygenase (PhyH)